MKSLFLLLIVIVSCFTANAQKIIISGKETSRLLKWKDFAGKPDNSSPYYANTWWNIKYKYDDVKFQGDAAILSNFQVILELDPEKSWLKEGRQTDELLVHEQGHFNLGILCMREFLDAVNKTTLSRSNFNVSVQNIFKATVQKYKLIGLQYDQETNHSMNKEEQKKWNEFFATNLATK